MNKENYVGFLPFYLLVFLIFIGIAKSGSQVVTTIAENTPVRRGSCIIIDAGHGGEDGGATSCTGMLESQINLEIALKLDDLLQFLGLETQPIRKTDTSVYTEGSTIAQKKVSDLKERVRIANSREGAVLISIHQNIFADSRYDGAQVFYAKTSESKRLAEDLQKNLVSTVNRGSNRKCKLADSVYLMQNISCTGVLIECGFLSNPREEADLRDPAYQKKLCCVIASTVSSYLFNNSQIA